MNILDFKGWKYLFVVTLYYFKYFSAIQINTHETPRGVAAETVHTTSNTSGTHLMAPAHTTQYVTMQTTKLIELPSGEDQMPVCLVGVDGSGAMTTYSQEYQGSTDETMKMLEVEASAPG